MTRVGIRYRHQFFDSQTPLQHFMARMKTNT